MSAFLFFLACVFGSLASLLFILRVIARLTYNDRDRALDRLRGFRREFPLLWPFVISVVCWGWVYARPI